MVKISLNKQLFYSNKYRLFITTKQFLNGFAQLLFGIYKTFNVWMEAIQFQTQIFLNISQPISYLFFQTTKLEKALLHKYTVVNPIDVILPHCFIQNKIKMKDSKSHFSVESQDSSMKESSSAVYIHSLVLEKLQREFWLIIYILKKCRTI